MSELRRPKHPPKPTIRKLKPASESRIPDIDTMTHPELVEEMKFLNRKINELSTKLSASRLMPFETEKIKEKQRRMIVRHRTIQSLIQSCDFETFASRFIETAQEYLPQEVFDSIERRAKKIVTQQNDVTQ